MKGYGNEINFVLKYVPLLFIFSPRQFDIFFVQAKVVDVNGEMTPFGTPGELLIRGYVNMNGYFNDEAKTKETINSIGWLHTG